MDFAICHPEESEYFGNTYAPVIEAIQRANDACLKLISAAKEKADGQNENVLWMLAASCLMEFEDIFLLAGNGRGVGATKLLRAFYERVVVFSYLTKERAEIQRFIDYTDVHWHKLLVEATDNHASFTMDQALIDRIRENYQKIKAEFQRTKCKKCQTTELMPSWSKDPVPGMASKINDVLRGLAFNAYLRPTFHIHTTYLGITDQCKVGPDGKFWFSEIPKQRELAIQALEWAHILLLQVMDTVNIGFTLGMDGAVAGAGKDWKISWEAVKKPAAPGSEPESPQPAS